MDREHPTKPLELSKGLGGNIVSAARFVLLSTGDFDCNLCISLSTSYWAGAIKLLEYPPDRLDRGITGYPQNGGL